MHVQGEIKYNLLVPQKTQMLYVTAGVERGIFLRAQKPYAKNKDQNFTASTRQ